MVKFTKGYKYRIYPNNEQKRFLAQSFGCARFVYNYFLAESKKAYENKEDYSLNRYEMVKRLPFLKIEYPWLNNVSSISLQQSVLDLARTYTNFFNNVKKGVNPGFPKFKKRNSRNSIRLTKRYFDIREGKLWIGRLDSLIKIKLHRDLPSIPSSCVVSQNPDGRYYVSFVCEYKGERTQGKDIIGIDVGLNDFLVTSIGTKIPNPKYLTKSENKLAKLQRSLSRKKKDSNNWNKARLRVAKLHAKIRDQRNDFLHNVSRKLVSENQGIVIESLNVKGMVCNKRLSKAISDVSWSKFFEYIKYKANESLGGCKVREAPLFYASTQLCSDCGTKSETKLKLHVRKWECPQCGSIHDRDVNAAKNLVKWIIEDSGISGLYNWVVST